MLFACLIAQIVAFTVIMLCISALQIPLFFKWDKLIMIIGWVALGLFATGSVVALICMFC